tara:strand:- start:22226 stop:23620 length:1395 start_codon:yes stop_codon:yes gene_type:complete
LYLDELENRKMDSLNLKRQRLPLADRLNKIVREANASGWTNDKRAEFDKLEKEIDRLGSAAADAERQEKNALVNDARNAGIEESNWHEKKAAQTKNVITNEMRQNAFRAWCFGGQPSAVRSEWADAAKACGVDLRSPEFGLELLSRQVRSEDELRARINEHITYRATTAQSLTNAAGGFTVANDNSLMGSVERALLEFGGQRLVSRVIRTAAGNDLPIPQSDDTTNSASLITEGSTVTIQSLTFSQTVLGSYKWSSYVVSSAELLEDTAINLEQFVGDAIGERIARGTNASFTNGTGSSQPKGAVHAAVVTVTGSTATGGDITLNNIVDLYHSVDPAYRRSPSFAFQCNDGILSELRKLVSSDGVPLWQASLRDDAPNLILGTPVNINQDMTASSTAAAAKILVAGDFSKHIIRDVANLRIRRNDQALAVSDQVGWVAFSRHDSAILFSTSATASQPLVALQTT